MSFTGVTINKLHGGLGRRGDQADRVVLLVSAVDETAAVRHYKPVELLSIESVDALGLSASDDLLRGHLSYYHLEEIFRLSPERRCWFMAVPKTLMLTNLMTNSSFEAGVRETGANTIGIAGLSITGSVFLAGINAAQSFVDRMKKEFFYIDSIILEGKGGYIPATVTGMDNLRDLNASNVSVVIAQDPAVASAGGSGLFTDYAAVGTVLGSLSVRAVHENVGSVNIEVKPRNRRGTSTYDISDSTLGRWMSIGLSNGRKFSTLTLQEQSEITLRGYIFAGSFNGFAGVYLSNSPTCTDITDDYGYIEYNAVWNKAAKIVRNTLLPLVRSNAKTDAGTGFVAGTVITYWDGLVRAALEDMVAANDISGFDVYIDPEQKTNSGKPFKIRLTLVANGIVHEFDVDMGFTNKIE